jgi:tripartite-type tricarboxylate transporter receptor subunit TctC
MNAALPRRTLLGAAASLLGAPLRAEDAWPSRPIRIVVPFTPGGFNDILARLIAENLRALVGQSGVVDNRPGAGGTIGSALVARSPPDGYQLLLANTATLVFDPLIYANPGYDPRKDFTPLGVCARLANVLVVNPAVLPVDDVAGLLARARSGTLHYATSGVGSSPHLATELLRTMVKADFTHVPYRGSAPALVDLLAGNVGFMFDNVPNVLQQLGPGGKLRALAVTGSARDPALPDVPTLQEAGITGYEMYVWFGLAGPAGLAPPVRQRLTEAVRRTVAMPTVAERVRQVGAEVWTLDPDAMQAQIGADLDKWRPVVRSAGVRAD